MTEETKIKQTKNLFNSLIKDENSVFYPADHMNKTLINKAKMSFYTKDKVFENIEEVYAEKNNEPNLSLTTPFLQKRKDINRSTLYSFKGLFDLLHAGIADLKFLAKSTADRKYCFLVVDLFTSKICTYPVKKRKLLKKKLDQFYSDILKKRKPDQEIRLQTDQEFQQNKIKNINAVQTM